jgi:hypothetical protein
VYQFSRSIYRELVNDVMEDSRRGSVHGRQLLLQACERSMERLAADPRYFARPSRFLFLEVRSLFPIQSQLKVLRVIERHMVLARGFIEHQQRSGLNLDGTPMSCHATTRKGSPCQRTPLPGSRYCPSHQHLLETELVAVSAA